MNQDQFDWNMKRLIGVYGEKAYPTERIKLFWNELRHIEGEMWEAIVDALISDSQYPPMISKIRECVSLLRDKFYSRDRIQAKLDAARWCDRCHKTGAVCATSKSDFSIWVFRCPCECGELKNYKYPSWNIVDQSKYFGLNSIEKFDSIKKHLMVKEKPNTEKETAAAVDGIIKKFVFDMPK